MLMDTLSKTIHKANITIDYSCWIFFFLLFQLLFLLFIIQRRDDYGYFFLAFVINLIFDYLLFDMLLLGYAFYDIDSVYL